MSSRLPAPLRALLPFALGVAWADRLLLDRPPGPASEAATGIPVLLLIALGLLAACIVSRSSARRAAPWLLLAVAGFAAFAIPVTAPLDAELRQSMAVGKPILVRGMVERWEPRSDGGRAWFRVAAVASGNRFRAAGARLLVTWPSGVSATADGEMLELKVVLRPLAAPRNPGEWDGRRHFRRRGVDGRATLARDGGIRARRAAPLLSVSRGLSGLRRAVGASIDRRLAGFPGRFARVLLLGDRVAFLPAEEAAFRKAGVTHVLSVSGLHVGLVAATVALIAGRRRRPGALAVSSLAIWTYTLLVGAPAAAVRSAAMLSIALVARQARRRGSALSLLSAAAFLVVVAAPGLLFDIGFQLSVLSIAGLIAVQWLLDAVPGYEAWPKLARVGTSVLALTLGAQLATAPVTIPLWGDWPLVAPLANLLVVGLSDLILTGGFLALAFDLVDGAAADRVYAVVWGMSRLLDWIVSTLARWSPGVSGLLPPPEWVAPALVATAVGFCLLRAAGASRRWQGSAALSLVGLVVALVAWPPPKPPGLVVTLLDVGQGDAVFVEFPDGRSLLVDAGEGGRFDTGARVVLPAVRAAHHRTIDAVVVSHEHLDHIGGLPAVLASGRVRGFHDSGYGPDEGFAAMLRADAVTRGVPACLVSEGDTLLVGADYTVTVLWPPAPEDPLDDRSRPANQLNNLSVVVLVTWRDHRLVLAGDLEAEGEEALHDRLPEGPIDFLKVGHHGSRTSSSPEFVDRLRPRIAGVSLGERNKFKHPSAAVMARLAAAGARVHRTDRDGALRLTYTDRGTTVETWGDGRTRGYRREPLR